MENLNIKIVLFIFILLTIVPTSSAETITGSSFELVNGSGNFIWNSQNFPALREGDTLEVHIEDNTMKLSLDKPPGIILQMKTFPIIDLFDDVFPLRDRNFDKYLNLKSCIDYLSNKYCMDSSQFKIEPVVIDKNLYILRYGDHLLMRYKLDGNYETINQISADRYYTEKSAIVNGADVLEGNVFYHSGDFFVYYMNISTNSLEVQGTLNEAWQLKIPSSYGKLLVTKNDSFVVMTNRGDILLGDTTDITDRLKLIKTGNSIYPSASPMKIVGIGEIFSNPTPTPTSTPTTTATSSPIPTVTQTPTSTPTPSPSPTITPTSSPTVTATVTPTPTPAPTLTSQLEQEVKELKERLNKTEEKQTQQDSRISWLESAINSILNWLKSII